MPQWDTTIAFIGILLTLAFSIFTPSITTFLSNRFQLKLKHTEYLQQSITSQYSKKAELYGLTLESVGKYLHWSSNENSAMLGAYLYQLYLYLPDEFWPLLDNLADSLGERISNDSHLLLTELSKVLSSELSKDTPIDLYDKRNYRKYRKAFAHKKVYNSKQI